MTAKQETKDDIIEAQRAEIDKLQRQILGLESHRNAAEFNKEKAVNVMREIFARSCPTLRSAEANDANDLYEIEQICRKYLESKGT